MQSGKIETSPRKRSFRPGTACVELALILSLLIAIVLACIDFGRFAYSYIALTNAVRAGAAYGIMNPYLVSEEATWKAQVQQRARDEMDQQTGYNPANLTVQTTSSIEADGLRRVQVDGSYPFLTIVSWPGIPNNVTMRRVVEMRVVR